MAHFHVTHPWSERAHRRSPVTAERLWLDRRQVLRALGFGGALAAGAPVLAGQRTSHAGQEANPTTDYPASSRWLPAWKPAGGPAAYPAKRNAAYRIRRSLSPEDSAAVYNNFYEFLPSGAGPVHKYVGEFQPRPWQIRIGGEVEEERTIDVDEIAKIAPLEERLYHFRCVETWSMVVPWTGIALADFIAWCKPKASARFVRFVTFGPDDLDEPQRKHEPPGFQRAAHYRWPYYEGLRMDEATNELAFLVTGIYGHGLPMQHGAPARVIVPWKYGYKSPKSLRRIEFTSERPGTFWSDLQPREYPFLSNVEPDVPHPRWSQATEWDITTRDRLPTLPYNGYADYVAKLYT